MEIKVQILTPCEACHGAAYLPLGEAISPAGEHYLRYAPCSICSGSGRQTRWIGLEQFALLLAEVDAAGSNPLELSSQSPLDVIQPVYSQR